MAPSLAKVSTSFRIVGSAIDLEPVAPGLAGRWRLLMISNRTVTAMLRDDARFGRV